MVSIINICCALFWLKGRFLFLKCLVKVFINKFYFIAGLKNEEKLVTWTTKSTKLLISLRREKAGLFDKGKVRKKVAWDKVAELLTMPMHRDTLDIETIRYLTAGLLVRKGPYSQSYLFSCFNGLPGKCISLRNMLTWC